MAKIKPQTAAEFLKAQASNEDYVRRIKEIEQAREAYEDELLANIAPLLTDLKGVGVVAKSPWDLIGKIDITSPAIAVLCDHLGRPYLDRNREGIARALALRGAGHLWARLYAEYENTPSGSGFKIGLADALGAVMKEDHASLVYSIVQDAENGESRLMLIEPLLQTRFAKEEKLAQAMEQDPFLKQEVRRVSKLQ